MKAVDLACVTASSECRTALNRLELEARAVRETWGKHPAPDCMHAADQALHQAVTGYFDGSTAALGDFRTVGPGFTGGLTTIRGATHDLDRARSQRSTASCG